MLRAAQVVVDEGLARPLLIGRPEVIARAHRAVRAAPEARPRLRVRRLLDDPRRTAMPARSTTSSTTPQRRVARGGADRDAQPQHAARRHAACASGKADAMLCGTVGRFADHLRLRARRDRPARRRAHARRDADADAAGPAAVHLRHPRQRRSERRAGRGDHAAGGRGGAPLRHHAERRVAVALELRRLRRARRGQDARSAGADPRARSAAGGRRRDARRRRPVEGDPRPRVPRLAG